MTKLMSTLSPAATPFAAVVVNVTVVPDSVAPFGLFDSVSCLPAWRPCQ